MSNNGKIDLDTLKKLGKLSRIPIDETSSNKLMEDLNKIIGFIEKKANVKISVTFRGRELGNTSFGKTLLDTIIKETEDIASVLVEPKFENRTYSALLTPKKVK